ncbi:MAG TPA: magnesium transporter, partial [Corynebacterium nuruki]|nr:magnesium transporter [Corynebacterium nuruki]
MSASRVFVGRLAGMILLGADGESVGRVRDVVVSIRPSGARALGLVGEVAGKRRIFVPMLRIASVDPKEVTMNTSSVNLRPFRSRAGEVAAIDDLMGSRVHVEDPEFPQLSG